MADVAIPSLPALAGVALTDVLVVDNGVQTGKAQANQLPVSALMQAALDLKAALASPAFTGVPTAPTAAGGTNTQQLATTAFVQAALAALVDTSPAALDTLNELAAALGDDPNFAATMTTALAGKQAASAVLTTLAGASANGQSLVTAANYAAMRALLSLNNVLNVEQAARFLTVQAPKTGAYTLQSTDARTVVPYNSAASGVFTLNAGLTAGFSVVIPQTGTGVVSVSGSATLRGVTTTALQYDVLTITPIGANEYLCKVG